VAAAGVDPGTPTVAYPISKSRVPALGFSIEIVRLSEPFNPSDTARDVGETWMSGAGRVPPNARFEIGDAFPNPSSAFSAKLYLVLGSSPVTVTSWWVPESAGPGMFRKRVALANVASVMGPKA